jgi:hypothetical protein
MAAYRQQPESQVLQLGRRGLNSAAAFAESIREVRVLDLHSRDLERGGQEGQHRQPEALAEDIVEHALQLLQLALDRVGEALELGVAQPPVAAGRGVYQAREVLKVSKDDGESDVHEAVDGLHATGRAMPTSVGYEG